LNIWFIGTGIFASLCLEGLTKRGVTFTRIITGLPTRSGRNGKENPSPVEVKAQSLGLTVTRTGKLSENHELIHELEVNRPDVIFVIDFGQLIREPFLSQMCLNIHPSLLPDLRGAAPIQRALMNGYTRTGVTLFRLVKAMDAGDILAQREIAISPDDDAEDLYVRLSDLGSELAHESLNCINGLTLIHQDESLATYAPKIEKSEHEVSFDMTAGRIINTVRALAMSGGAYIIIRKKRVKLWRVSLRDDMKDSECGRVLSLEDALVISCADSAIEIHELQSEGKNIMFGIEWARGMRIKKGDILQYE
jgi:methionyl-tRNA formyltransferase